MSRRRKLVQRGRNKDTLEMVKEQALWACGFRCEACGDAAAQSARLQFHHVVPRRAGGRDTLANCCILCGDCHSVWHKVAEPAGLPFASWLQQRDAYFRAGGERERFSREKPTYVRAHPRSTGRRTNAITRRR